MEVYLDNAASTIVKPEVLARFNEVAENLYANPSSVHTAGYEAGNCIYSVQKTISEKLGCKSEDVYFTTGATMSNQLLIQGFVKEHPNAMVITTNVEHNDIMMLLENLDCYKHILRVNSEGLIDISELSEILRYSSDEMNVPVLVSIQMANSETGIIQDIHKICSTVKKFPNTFLHMDATQYIPCYPINMECWGIDALSMSGQKIGGLKGSGLLVMRQMMRINTCEIIYGEQGFIGGTPATPLIASLGTAFELLDYNNDELANKRDFLLQGLEKLGGILVGTKENRLPNNIYIRFPGVNGMTLLNLLNDYEIYIGTGSACSSDSDKPSHVALAYGLTEEEAFECVRFTLGDYTMEEELNYTLSTVETLLTLLR